MSCRLPLLVASVALVGSLILSAAEPAKPLIVKSPLTNKTYNIDELRKKLAYETLADRLAYEKEHRQQRVAAPKGFLDTEEWRVAELTEKHPFGPWHWSNSRAEALQQLHSEKVEEFVNREGFGGGRMVFEQPSPNMWELPVVKAIPYPKLPAQPDDDSAGVVLPPRDEADYKAMRWPAVPMLASLHDQSRTNFLNPRGFGHVKDREHVAGFQEHQFRSLPSWEYVVLGKRAPIEFDGNLPIPVPEPKPVAPKDGKETWAVRRLELVSLLKHETPVAYVSDDLPRMEALRSKDAKTRALSDFEGQALKEVKEGKNVVAEATPNRIRMMGAIRATESCLKCHDAQRGDLLGTFTYELQRDPLLALKK